MLLSNYNSKQLEWDPQALMTRCSWLGVRWLEVSGKIKNSGQNLLCDYVSVCDWQRPTGGQES